MSLWCGSCREEIFEGFGILYCLERDEQGKLRYPNRAGDYSPPNSALCDHCYEQVPSNGKLVGEVVKRIVEEMEGAIYIYAPADSNSDPFWRSKTWSGIVVREDEYIYLSYDIVVRLFPQALEIISGTAVLQAPENIVTEEAAAAMKRRYGDAEADRIIRTFKGQLH